MGKLIHPQSELVREPNLLIPGKRPVGPVEVTDESWIRDHLLHFYLFDTLKVRDYAGTLDGTLLGTCVQTPRGLDTSTGGVSLGGEPGIEGKSALTFMLQVDIKSGALSDSCLYAVNQKISTVYSIWGSSSDVFQCSVANSSYVLSPSGLTAGKHNFIIIYDAGTVKMFHNGKLSDTKTDGDTATGTTGNSLYLSRDIDPFQACYQAFAIWDKCLSDEQAGILGRDYYRTVRVIG